MRCRLPGLLLLAACSAPPVQQAPPPNRDSAPPVDWEAQMEARLQELLTQIGRDYTPREKSVDLSNSMSLLQEDIGSLDKQVREFIDVAQRAAESNPETSQEIKGQLAALADTLTSMTTRVDEVERDIGLAMGDSQELRSEVRAMLRTLQAYRDAYRDSLEIRRSALRRELELLDALLSEAEEVEARGDSP